MRHTFAEIVEDVKQLSFSEKEELQELLRQDLVEERLRVHRQTGSAKSEISLSDGFDEPLEDFAEYME